MARGANRGRKAAKMRGATKPRILALLLLIALVLGAWGWWQWHHWLPDRATFPVQGVEVGADDGPISWNSMKAIGADFAYIDASASAFARASDAPASSSR